MLKSEVRVLLSLGARSQAHQGPGAINFNKSHFLLFHWFKSEIELCVWLKFLRDLLNWLTLAPNPWWSWDHGNGLHLPHKLFEIGKLHDEVWYIFRVWQGPPAVLCEDRRAAPVPGALQRKCECLYFFIIFKIYNYYLNFIKVTDINFKYFHCLSYMSQLSRRGHVTSKHRIIIIPDICPVNLDTNPSQYNINPDTFPCVRTDSTAQLAWWCWVRLESVTKRWRVW